jgi:hypothetical protein
MRPALLALHYVMKLNRSAAGDTYLVKVSIDLSSTAAPDQWQDLIYGEEYHVTREFVREHGVVATSADARYELVI